MEQTKAAAPPVAADPKRTWGRAAIGFEHVPPKDGDMFRLRTHAHGWRVEALAPLFLWAIIVGLLVTSHPWFPVVLKWLGLWLGGQH